MSGTEYHHDLIVLFGDTAETSHDLVLVVGREPNNPAPFSPTVGTYDFRAQYRRALNRHTTCAFWDQSYGTLAKVAGIGIGTLKSACLARNASPIGFTDVSPVPVAYTPGSGSMRAAREAITDRQIDDHVCAIFSMPIVQERVRLVVLSGHRHGSFSKREARNLGYASSRMAARCEALGKACVDTRFMFGNNQRMNIEMLRASGSASDEVRRVLGEFLASDAAALPKAG